jgi:predicted nucleic acid-binding protein
MSFIIDTDICSAHLRGDAKTFNKFLQHMGGLHVSTISIAELYAWVTRQKTAPRYREGLEKLLPDLQVISFDHPLAIFAGNLRGNLLDQGIIVPQTDLFIAATALFNNFTVVTHNIKHYALIPDLRIQDWQN